MPERFGVSARSAVERALDLASDEGADAVEAEHILIALTRRASDRTAEALRTLGMSEETVRAALDRESATALEAVGVGALARPPSQRVPKRSNPRLGRSAKLALERTAQVAVDRGDRRFGDHHILLAISRAEAGVIPRVLDELAIAADDIESAIR